MNTQPDQPTAAHAQPAPIVLHAPRYGSAQLLANEITLHLHYIDPDCLRIPATDYALSKHTTISDLARAIGLKTFDYALPQSFFDEYMDKHGTPPRGVWSYDRVHAFGEFFSLDAMIAKVADMIKEQQAHAAPPFAGWTPSA